MKASSLTMSVASAFASAAATVCASSPLASGSVTIGADSAASRPPRLTGLSPLVKLRERTGPRTELSSGVKRPYAPDFVDGTGLRGDGRLPATFALLNPEPATEENVRSGPGMPATGSTDETTGESFGT